MKQKINFRLAIIALIAIVASTIGITLVCFNQFQAQVKNDLKTNARILAETEIFEKSYGNQELIEDAADPFGLATEDLRITWVDSDGIVLYDNDTDAKSLPNHLNRPEVLSAVENGYGESVRKSDTFNMDTYYYAMLLDNGTILRVGMEAKAISGIFLNILPIIAFIAIAILIICVIISHALTKQLIKPIEEMAENLDDTNTETAYKELEPFADKIRSQHENILEAAKSRQDFTANVSHELKTPLTAISGYAELIENGLVDKESIDHVAEQIRHNSNRLLTLINDIIKLSELDHNELPRTFDKVDLGQTARESCENLKMNAIQKQVTIKCEAHTAVISADKSMIREMLDNLIQNAIQYNRENGVVTVTTMKEDGHPVLIVSDTGIGIPKESQNRVFERFYRVDKSRSRQTGGTGLGLAIVKHIAEIHDAEISLKSEHGKGTEIKIRF